MAPPPMPNTPARNPDSMPTATSNGASSTSSEASSPAIAIPQAFLCLASNTRVPESCFRYTSLQRPPTVSMATIARLIRRCEPRFVIADFGRCARCFDFVNRIPVPRSPKGSPRAGPQTVKAADDRQDRTTAFAAPADLSLDPDDGTVHRPSRNRRCAVFRHSAAGVVADRSGVGTHRLFQCAGLYLKLHRPADRIRLYLGAAASSAQRSQAFRLGPRLWFQGERTRSDDLGRADRRYFAEGAAVDCGRRDRRRTMTTQNAPGAKSMRTPLARVRSLGASHSGTSDFWRQRVTAVAMTLLIVPVIVVVMMLLGRNQAGAAQILGSLPIAIIMLLFIVASAWHMKIGMQVVIEDYVHNEKLKLASVMANNFFSIAVALASIYAILKLSSGV